MCSPGYHHNGFVATHALGHMMYRTSCAQNHHRPYIMCVQTVQHGFTPQSHCGDNREGTLFS